MRRHEFAIGLIALTCSTVACATTISTWANFDHLVDEEFASFDVPSDLHIPSPVDKVVDKGVTVASSAILDGLVTTVAPKELEGAQAWTISVQESGTEERVRQTFANGVLVRTVKVEGYDRNAWVESVYGTPPSWLSLEEKEQWYVARDRGRISLLYTFVPEETMLKNALSVKKETLPMSWKTEKRHYFLSLLPSYGLLSFNMFTPETEEVSVYAKTNLSSKVWTFAGKSKAFEEFVFSATRTNIKGAFLGTTKRLIDSDGDGIADDVEQTSYGTNPNKIDTSGDCLTDWEKICRYELNPCTRDTDGDGYEDDEEIIGGLNPKIVNEGAGTTIRYYYDDDDRLVGTYIGALRGSIVQKLSPAGNPCVISERAELQRVETGTPVGE